MAGTTKKKTTSEIVEVAGKVNEQIIGNKITMLPVDDIRPFHKHPFRLYEGERLRDMVDSVKEHGILNPVIVRKYNGTYEMLSGHNRQNAAKIAGIKEIPAIVKEKLNNEEAYVYVIETNLMQRSFTDLTTTEKAVVLAERYDKVMSQGKRNDILKELESLNKCKVTSGHSDQKLWSRDELASEYGLSSSSVARLLRVNHLIPEMKKMIDDGSMSLMAGVQLSYLPEQCQKIALLAAEEAGITINKDIAIRVRNAPMTEKGIKEAVMGEQLGSHPMGIVVEKKGVYKPIKLSAGLREKYFQGMKDKEIEEVVEKAIEAWMKRKGRAKK